MATTPIFNSRPCKRVMKAPAKKSHRKPARAAREKPRVAAIDIGGDKAACVIAECAHDGAHGLEAEIVGVGQNGGRGRENRDSIEISLRAAVEQAERMAGERIKSAYVVAGGRSLSCRHLNVELDVVGGCVTDEDVADVLEEAARAAAPQGARKLHSLASRYAVDGEPVLDEPVGLYGDVLSAAVIGLSVRDSLAANLEALLEDCGIGLDGVLAGPYVAAESVLIEDEKELGAILIDIGARTTDYAVYERGGLVAVGGVNVGGRHVTRDVAQIFGAPLAAAERIKTLHGGAIAGQGDEHRHIDCLSLGAPGETTRITRAELVSVIAPRMEEIFELVVKEAAVSGVRRAVLTGGGSLLVGAREISEKVLGVKARLGRPAQLTGAPEAARAPQFAASIGAIQYAVKNYKKRRVSKRARLAPQPATGSLIAGVGGWLKQNF